jgi:hypothetical protein
MTDFAAILEIEKQYGLLVGCYSLGSMSILNKEKN